MKSLIIAFAIVLQMLVHTHTSNDFPSLLTTNATIAVVIDREYTLDHYETIKNEIEKYIAYAKREMLLHGGLNVKYFSWANINFKREFLAVLTVASCADTWNVYKATVKEEILQISITTEDCPRLPKHKVFTIRVVPSGDELPQMLFDLRTANKLPWTSFTFVHDDIIDYEMTNRIINMFSQTTPDLATRPSSVLIYKVANDSIRSTRLKDLSDKLQSSMDDAMNYLIVVDFDLVTSIMQLAKTLKLTTPTNQWLYVLCNARVHSLAEHIIRLDEGENIAFATNVSVAPLNTTWNRVICHAKQQLAAFVNALDKAFVEEMQTSKHMPEEEWEAYRANKLDLTRSLFTSMQKYRQDSEMCATDIKYEFEASDTWGKSYQQTPAINQSNLIRVGYWRPVDGTQFADELFPHITHGFRGRVLPLVTYHDPPWQIVKVNASGDILEFGGVIHKVLDEIAKQLNFTYTLETPAHDLTPKQTFNPSIVRNLTLERAQIVYNTSTIVLDMVRKKSVMMCACAMTVTAARRYFVNFTRPIHTQAYSFLVARPRTLSRAALFLSPFAFDTWLCLFASLLLIGPMLNVIHRLSPTYDYNDAPRNGGLFKLRNCIWYVYGALMQQGGMYLPTADSGRVLVGTWWLVVLVLVTTYSGNLVAFLTFPQVDTPIESIEDLLDRSPPLTWSLIRGTAIDEHFRTSDIDTFERVYKFAELRNKVDVALLHAVTAGRHAYFDWKYNLEFAMKFYFLHTNSCQLNLAKEDVFADQLAMILAKDNPYLDMINQRIKKLQQTGLIDKWIKEMAPNKDRCANVEVTADVENHTVNMDDMQGCFFVLLFGMLVSVACITTEMLWHRSKMANQRNLLPFTK